MMDCDVVVVLCFLSQVLTSNFLLHYQMVLVLYFNRSIQNLYCIFSLCFCSPLHLVPHPNHMDS